MKIVFICNEYPPAASGGIGTFTRGLAEALVQHGHEVKVVGLYRQSGITESEQGGVRVIRLPIRSGLLGSLVNRIRLSSALESISRDGPIDVLEAPDFEGHSAFLPRRARAHLVRLHGSHRYFADERRVPHSSPVTFFERHALLQADGVVSVSAYTASRTRDLFGLARDIPVVHNAVSIPKRAVRKTDYRTSCRVVYFGTLAEKKGVLPLADAWRQFHADFPEWELVLMGRDTEHQGRSVKSMMIERMGDAAKVVTFTGALAHHEILERLVHFDFAVLPSYSEAFSLAPMEAMAVGLPVILSKMSSGPELVDDGVDGWFCDPRDSRTLLEAMRRAATDQAQRERVAFQAKNKIENVFSYEKFVGKNIALYEALRSRQGAP